MEENTTNTGRLTLVKLWNKNRKSADKEVKERAIEMLLNAFDSPQDMIIYFKEHGIEYGSKPQTNRQKCYGKVGINEHSVDLIAHA